jgi:ribose transport system substrate-binding protein
MKTSHSKITKKKENIMSRSKAVLVFCLLVLLLQYLGCSKLDHDPKERYFLVCINAKIPYWQMAAAGLNQAASQMKVRADVAGPDNYDPKAQQQEFQRVLHLNPSGILVSPADAEILKNEINSAIAKGIPVITIDADSPASQRLLYIGTNNYQAGIMGGKKLAEVMKGKGNVVVFTMPEQTNLKERLNGYQSVLAEHPQMKISEIVDIKGDSGLAFDKTKELLDKNPAQVDAFVCLEATAAKDVALALSRKGVKDKIIIAMDTDQGTLEGVKNGVIVATIAQKPFTMTYYGLKMLDDLYHHKLPSLQTNWSQDPFSVIPSIVDTGATLVDRNNVEEFIKAQESKAATPKS